MHIAHGEQKFILATVLHEITIGPNGDQSLHHSSVLVHAQHHHFDFRTRLFDALGGLDPVHHGHVDVHEHHVNFQM